MSDASKEHDPRHIARYYTARIKAIVLGSETAATAGNDRAAIPAVPPASANAPLPPAGPLKPASVAVLPPPSRPAVSPPLLPIEPEPKSLSLPAGSGFNPLRTAEEHVQHPRGRFAEILSQVQRLRWLGQLLHAFLPPHLQDHTTLVRLDVDAWVVLTDSPAWQTRLRYFLPTLRQPLSEKLGFTVPPPQIRIVPPETLPQAPPVRRMTMTDETAQVLEEAARQFSDPRLSAAVRRLAEHGRQRNRQA